jgi:hypothetical protein
MSSFGQTFSQPKYSTHTKPIFFLDSTKIDLAITVFDPNKILSITVEKEHDTINYTQGRVYMVSKNPKDYYFASLERIKNKYAKNATTPVLFMVNNSFLQNNISDFRIDTSYILNVEVLRGTDFDNLKESIPNLTIIRIRTKTKDNLEELSKIRIRGRDLSLTK